MQKYLNEIHGYTPYRNEDGTYRTGLTEKRKKELEKKYNIILDDKYYETTFYQDNMPLNEIAKTWLSVHPDYRK